MKKFLVAATALCALTFAGACASTATTAAADDHHAEADSSKKAQFAHVDWAQVEQSMATGAILVDSRKAESFAEGHIAGAINIPFADTAAWNKLPSDKSTKVITYCGGPACGLSAKAASKCAEMGFTDVAEYKGGYPEWKKLKGGQ